MTIAIAPDPRVKIRVDAVCHTCKVRHKIECDPRRFHAESWDWYAKHDPRTHDVEYYSTDRVLPKGLDERPYETIDNAPWWLEYKENANILIAYASAATITIDPAANSGLDSSNTFIIHRAGTAVDNTTNKYLDARVTGKVKTSASQTAAKTIRIYAYANQDDTPTYPAICSSGSLGSDAEVTLSDAVLLSTLAFLGSIATYGSAAVTYEFGALRTIASAYGFMPKFWAPTITHDSGQVLSTTAGDHVWKYTGMYVTN